MTERVNLLEGNILKSLIAMSLPIMATSLLQMAYSMTDMIWIGRIGSDSVAAVGAAGMFVNLAEGLCSFSKVGGQVKVAQTYGAKRNELAAKYAKNAIQTGIIVSIIYGLFLSLFFKNCISFFNFTNMQVIKEAETYLRVMGAFIIFSFVNPIFTSLITATGNSKTPFKISTVGLICNIVLDPIFIFGFGIIPRMNVLGAAIATVIAQAVVCILYIIYLAKDEVIFKNIKIFTKPNLKLIKDIVRIGLPTSIQGIMFTGISMTIGRIVAAWGETAIAVQKVGVQVESISYMAAHGFASATNSFIAQNYGANNLPRAKNGYSTALWVMICWGIATTAILIFLPAPIFGVFIPDKNIIPLGVDYLRILGYSQLFMCIEILTAGAFSAYSKTLPPSVVSIVFTGLRIPAAIIMGKTSLGLNGVWWSISMSSVFKGTILVALFVVFMNKFNKKLKSI